MKRTLTVIGLLWFVFPVLPGVAAAPSLVDMAARDRWAAAKFDDAPSKPVPPSIISADLKITGDLSSDGEIQIDGSVEGDIRTKTLLVGETALVKGEIHADLVRVHGRVDGQIKAQSVSLAKTAHVVGDVMHVDLSIETGAFLEGHCKRMEVEPATPTAKPTSGDGDSGKTGEKAKAKTGTTQPAGTKIAAAPA